MKGIFIPSHRLLYRVWVNSMRQCQQGWGISRHWGELVRIWIYSSERLQPGLLRLPSEESGKPERAVNTSLSDYALYCNCGWCWQDWKEDCSWSLPEWFREEQFRDQLMWSNLTNSLLLLPICSCENLKLLIKKISFAVISQLRGITCALSDFGEKKRSEMTLFTRIFSMRDGVDHSTLDANSLKTASLSSSISIMHL